MRRKFRLKKVTLAFSKKFMARFFRLTEDGLQTHPDARPGDLAGASFPDFMGEHNAGRTHTTQVPSATK